MADTEKVWWGLYSGWSLASVAPRRNHLIREAAMYTPASWYDTLPTTWDKAAWREWSARGWPRFRRKYGYHIRRVRVVPL